MYQNVSRGVQVLPIRTQCDEHEDVLFQEPKKFAMWRTEMFVGKNV